MFNATKRKSSTLELVFGSRSGRMDVTPDGKKATHQAGSTSHEFVLCKQSFSEGVHDWKIRIDAMNNNEWIFFGVNTLSPHEELTYARNHTGAFGLSSGSYSFINGSMTSVTLGVSRCFRPGDVIHMNLNCDTQTLTIREPTRNFEYVINNLTRGSVWHPMVNLYGALDSVSLNFD